MSKLLHLLCVSCAWAGAPVPQRASDVGFELGNSRASMKIEIFGDYQCPDTKAAWNSWVLPLAKTSAMKDKVSIVFHPFPLPYHKNGFDSAQAALVMATLGGEQGGEDAANTLFAAQDSFQTDATVNISQAQLFSDVFAPLAQKLGIAPTQFIGRMTNDDPTNEQARVAWKFGCARGVSGTPTFAANGVVADELADWDLPQWEKWIAAGSEPLARSEH